MARKSKTQCSRCGCEIPAGEQCPSCIQDFTLTSPEPRPKADTRYQGFQKLIFIAYQYRWDGAEPRWGPMEAKNLHTFLAENPHISEREFSLGLRNLLMSDDVPERQRPGYWLPKLDGYLNHPHNTFGRNPNAASTFPDQVRSRTNESAERYLANKNGNDRRLSAESSTAELGKQATVRKRLRGVGPTT